MKFSILPVISIFTCAVLSTAAYSIPERCPTLAELKTVNFDAVIKTDRAWMAFNVKNTYGTKDEWTLVVPFIYSMDKDKNPIELSQDEAAKLGKEKINNLSLIQGPEEDSNHKGYWECLYLPQNAPSFFDFVVVITPTLTKEQLSSNF